MFTESTEEIEVGEKQIEGVKTRALESTEGQREGKRRTRRKTKKEKRLRGNRTYENISNAPSKCA